MVLTSHKQLAFVLVLSAFALITLPAQALAQSDNTPLCRAALERVDLFTLILCWIDPPDGDFRTTFRTPKDEKLLRSDDSGRLVSSQAIETALWPGHIDTMSGVVSLVTRLVLRPVLDFSAPELASDGTLHTLRPPLESKVGH